MMVFIVIKYPPLSGKAKTHFFNRTDLRLSKSNLWILKNLRRRIWLN